MKLMKAKRLRDLQDYNQKLLIAEEEDYYLTVEEQAEMELFKIAQLINDAAIRGLGVCSYSIEYNKSGVPGVKTNMIKARLMYKGYSVVYDSYSNKLDISW